MGTSGSYKGGGGKPGRDLRQGVDEWLDSLPDTEPPEQPSSQTDGDEEAVPRIPSETVMNVVPMFRPRSTGGGGDGPGGMGGGSGRSRDETSSGRPRRGGAQRSAARSASTAGRAAAAAYALRTGNAGLLQELGLDYESLRADGDPIHVTQLIVEAACGGSISDGTIEDEERRKVAAEVAEWVLQENEGGAPPTPEEIVREAVARIIFEAFTAESAAQLRDGKRPSWATKEAERQVRESAEAIAAKAELSPEGATVSDFERAIEKGIETLRRIWGSS